MRSQSGQIQVGPLLMPHVFSVKQSGQIAKPQPQLQQKGTSFVQQWQVLFFFRLRRRSFCAFFVIFTGEMVEWPVRVARAIFSVRKHKKNADLHEIGARRGASEIRGDRQLRPYRPVAPAAAVVSPEDTKVSFWFFRKKEDSGPRAAGCFLVCEI